MLNATQVGSLGGDAPGNTGSGLFGLSAHQIGLLTASQVSGFNAAQAGCLTAAQIDAFSSSQISALSNAAIGRLTATNTTNLSGSQIAALSTSQVGSLTTAGAEWLYCDAIERTFVFPAHGIHYHSVFGTSGCGDPGLFKCAIRGPFRFADRRDRRRIHEHGPTRGADDYASCGLGRGAVQLLSRPRR